MEGLNVTSISGNLTRDPELKATGSGTAVLRFSVAVNERRKAQGGDWEDVPSYIDCVMFGRRAEALSRYLGKGTPVGVTGKLRQDRYTSKDGSKRSSLYVVADNVVMFRTNNYQQAQPAQQAQAQDVYDEDLPF